MTKSPHLVGRGTGRMVMCPTLSKSTFSAVGILALFIQPVVASERQVTCVVRDGTDIDTRIDQIGGHGFQYYLDEAIELIESGNVVFYTIENGDYAKVFIWTSQNGRRFLKTAPDDLEHNNLGNLPDC